MKKIFLLQIFIFFYLQYSYGQNSSVDSSTTNQIEKVYVGFYIMPASTFNLGNKIVPSIYDAADCFCRYEYSEIKEAGRISYTAGFEIESIKVFKKISFSTGLNFEVFNYSGSAMEKYNYFFSGHTSIENRIINYAYIDYFINLPVLVHLELANRKTEKLNVYFGASEGKNINESNSGGVNVEANNEFKKNAALVVFAVSGIDYFTGNKTLFNIGFRLSKQINHTPLGRMFASVGINAGIYF